MNSSTSVTNDKTVAARTSTHSRLGKKRWILWPVLGLLAILVITAGGYALFRPRVRPLKMPAVPSQLSATDLGLVQWQGYQRPLPAHPLDNPSLPSPPQARPEIALLEDAAGQWLIQRGQLEHGFAYLKAAAEADPDNLRYSNDYRLALRDHQRYMEEENFFAPLAQKLKTPNASINLALTYVDEMRACPKPPDGLVCQAQYSSRSISTLNTVLEKNPYNIVARYARGLNNLYWPTLMGHLPKAQEDLQFAVALAQYQNAISTAFTPQAYTALGDVFAKDGKIDEARNVWLNGLNVAAQKSLLESRLSIPQEQLVSEEENHLRGLGVYVDTDIALFWQKGR